MSLKTNALPFLSLLAVACGGADEGGQGKPEAAPGAAELAAHAELANEAAADEAADMSNFGGNAAAIDAKSSVEVENRARRAGLGS